MKHKLAFRRYRLPFRGALRTAHGPWAEREGILIRTEDEAGRTGYGEVAPIPWFGTETVEEAEEVLGKLAGDVDDATVESIPERLGCVRFALASALGGVGRIAHNPPSPAGERRVKDDAPNHSRHPVAALLPAGKAVLAAADKALEQGYVALKWKVGVHDAADEWGVLDDLLARLPAHVKLRLDANGAWNSRLAAKWLERCAERPVEFVEQPCFAGASQGPAHQRKTDDILLGLANDYPTPIALDESVTGMASLREWLGRGWRGVVVVKPALAGPPAAVLALLENHRADAVFSSALETAVGGRAALQVAFSYQGPRPRALGFGVAPLFTDARFDALPAVPFVSADAVEHLNPEDVWNALS
ncbi:MAG: o-succinylbenzoate synthase [Verrucomicrobia bacterium RIFCSPLOWO2_12_FULL_64_8]|nr:MAG: o-succinylbenzoate synthase [Verrucomicrobia bacterium RIFCSPLOWO2_12_FULL_64_8]